MPSELWDEITKPFPNFNVDVQLIAPLQFGTGYKTTRSVLSNGFLLRCIETTIDKAAFV